MSRQDGRPLIGAVEAGDEALVEGLDGRGFQPLRFALLHEVDRGLEAVVAVGDEELFRDHRVRDPFQYPGVGHGPEPVTRAVVVANVDGRRAAAADLVKQAVDRQPIVCVKHVEHVFVAARPAHEAQPVHLRFRQRPLVWKDPAGRMLQIQESDEPFLRPGFALDLVVLVVAVKHRRRVLHQDAFTDPLLQSAARVRVIRLGVSVLLAVARDPDDAVGGTLVVPLLQVFGDLIVGLGDDRVQVARHLRVEAVSSERVDLRHGGPRQRKRSSSWTLPSVLPSRYLMMIGV